MSYSLSIYVARAKENIMLQGYRVLTLASTTFKNYKKKGLMALAYANSDYATIDSKPPKMTAK